MNNEASMESLPQQESCTLPQLEWNTHITTREKPPTTRQELLEFDLERSLPAEQFTSLPPQLQKSLQTCEEEPAIM